MPPVNYAEVLSRRYNFQWSINGDLSNYANIVSLDGTTIPRQSDLDALWPGVYAEILDEIEFRSKEMSFQQQYPQQLQLSIIAQAQATGDNTELNTMLDFWNSL